MKPLKKITGKDVINSKELTEIDYEQIALALYDEMQKPDNVGIRDYNEKHKPLNSDVFNLKRNDIKNYNFPTVEELNKHDELYFSLEVDKFCLAITGRQRYDLNYEDRQKIFDMFKRIVKDSANASAGNADSDSDSDLSIYEGIDFFQKVGETIHEYNNRIAKDVYGKKYKELTKKEQVELEDIEQKAGIQTCESDEIKDFDLETAKKLYQMLGCIQVENAWVNVNHLSSAINNTTVRNKLKNFKYKKVENGKERISDYGEYLVTSALNNPDFPFYQRIAFKPFNEGLDEFEYNLWKENVYEDIPMDERGWKILDFIKKIICKDRKTVYRYLKKWIAFIIHKDKKTQVGIAVRGDGGEGKGTFAKIIEKLLNEKFYFINDIEEIHSRFNAHLFNKTFLCINDENGKGRGIESIKSKVTDDNFRYEIKCGAVVTDAKNHFNFLVLSNDDLDKLVPQLDEANKRRWIILEVSREHANDFNYFKEILKLLNDREVIQMLGNYFKKIDIEDWIPMDIPDTLEKRQAEIAQNTFLEYIVQAEFSDTDFVEIDKEKWIKKDTLVNLYNEWFSDPNGGGYDILKDTKKIVKPKSLGKSPIYLNSEKKRINRTNGVQELCINKKYIDILIERLKLENSKNHQK
jgi:hypothetical protein